MFVLGEVQTGKLKQQEAESPVEKSISVSSSCLYARQALKNSLYQDCKMLLCVTAASCCVNLSFCST